MTFTKMIEVQHVIEGNQSYLFSFVSEERTFGF